MRRIFFVLICFKLSILLGSAQTPEPTPTEEKPIIESVDVSGVPAGRISRDLRDRMEELVGQRFDQLVADEVAFEIQNRLSERISAIRQFPGSQPDRIKLEFVVGPIGDDPEKDSNVNSRYTVEDVEIRGIPESIVSDRIVQDIRKLVGEKLDEELARSIQLRMARELRPGRLVSRRVVRGLTRNHIRVIFDVYRAPLFGFKKLGNYIVAHSKQSVSFGIEAPIQHRNHRFTFAAVNDGDQLLERFAGYRLAFETIKAGTEHVGFRVEYFNYHDKWKAATELAAAATPAVPGIYRERRGIEPMITVAFDPRVRVQFGANVTELQIQYPQIHFENANSGVASVIFEDRWEDGDDNRHQVSANYSVRAGTRNLESDFIYTKHFGEARYLFRSRQNEFVATVSGGQITGTAPLFERFSLGNTSTLRGWNKYDLAPLGGDHVAYGSAEYRFTNLQVYYDVGSVWNKGSVREMSHAVGFGVHSRGNRENWFFTFGVPIRSGRIQPLKPVFMLGGRF
jgi:hypothetical protein